MKTLISENAKIMFNSIAKHTWQDNNKNIGQTIVTLKLPWGINDQHLQMHPIRNRVGKFQKGEHVKFPEI